MRVFFQDNTSEEIAQAARERALLLLPIGMVEEHGPHLPVSTDNIIAEGVAVGLAQRIRGRIPVLVMPTISYGFNGKTLSRWAGSVRASPESLLHYVSDVLESLVQDGFRKIMIINAHGQNPAMLEIACRKIDDAHGVQVILTYPLGMIGSVARALRKSRQGGAGGHADEIETSLILALREDLVKMDAAVDESCKVKSRFVAGDMFPDHEVLKGIYWSTFAVQGTRSGVLGDATAATAETGRKLLEVIIGNYEALAEEYYRTGEQQ
jgi:creatinine amidohydrolase